MQHTRHLFLSLPLKCIDWANETPLLQVWLPCSSDLLVHAQGSPISQVLVWTYVGSVPALPPRTSLLEKWGALAAEVYMLHALTTPLPAHSLAGEL